MEIYSDLSSAASKEFEQLLNSHHSKSPIEEGKIIEGVINKITEKYVFLYIENLKSEPVIDIQEAKSILGENLKEGTKIPVLIESLENKSGEVVVSASKAKKISGWNTLVKAYDNDEIVIRVNPRYFRPTEVDQLMGDSTKALKILGWKPEISLEKLIEEMIANDLTEAKKELMLKKKGFKINNSYE